jgi:ADP-ribose pyrophosphatase YjhB (NUDIX family)
MQDYIKTNPQLTPAVVCYLVKDGKITLGLRKRVSLGLGENLISGIGGKVGDVVGLENETFDEALFREVKEEVDVEITNYKKVAEIKFLFPNKTKWNQYVIAYLVYDWIGTPKETESIKPLTYNFNDIPFNQMWADNQDWLPLVLDNKEIVATFMYNDTNDKIIEKEINIIN